MSDTASTTTGAPTGATRHMANTATPVPVSRTWADHDREMSGIAAELIGAAHFIRTHRPNDDVFTANTFRKYAERFEAVVTP